MAKSQPFPVTFPIQLVVVIEITQLVIGRILNFVYVLPGRQPDVFVADV